MFKTELGLEPGSPDAPDLNHAAPRPREKAPDIHGHSSVMHDYSGQLLQIYFKTSTLKIMEGGYQVFH